LFFDQINDFFLEIRIRNITHFLVVSQFGFNNFDAVFYLRFLFTPWFDDTSGVVVQTCV